MKVLALAIGNTAQRAAVFEDGRVQWRNSAEAMKPVKELLAQAPVGKGDRACICSVVPAKTRSAVVEAKRKLGTAALLLDAKAAHGLRICYREPGRLGADRVAAALGAVRRFGRRNLIVVDCGTATTVTAIESGRSILGGAIIPGAALWARALAEGTAQLPRVAFRRPRRATGRSPEEAIEAGLYWGHAGAAKELVGRIATECFRGRRPMVVGTGGGADALIREGAFDRLEPDLLLEGLLAFAAGRSGEKAGWHRGLIGRD